MLFSPGERARLGTTGGGLYLIFQEQNRCFILFNVVDYFYMIFMILICHSFLKWKVNFITKRTPHLYVFWRFTNV